MKTTQKCITIWAFIVLFGTVAGLCTAGQRPDETVSKVGPEKIEIAADMLRDKIRGGLLGELLGNLNGLAHENKYYDKPGNVKKYVPALPGGARTDDDTDIEWIYIAAMQRQKTVMLSPEKITDLWKRYINGHIWCSNMYVRQLMDMGIEPPLTGKRGVNPWAGFNISGQFICESFGLVSPAMPQTAGRIGLHYTHVGIDGEPAQATQLFTAMIATAFVTDDIDRIIDAGLASVDKKSVLVPIITDVCRWHRENPDNPRETRRLIKGKYTLYESRMRNQNGYELCTAATIAALLYGNGDFAETIRHAFNFGWDADNNAATAGTIVGVIKGYNRLTGQGWDIRDVYHNTTRPGMPRNETITGFAERLTKVAMLVIAENGGQRINRNGKTFYRIARQQAINVEPLTNPQDDLAALRSQLRTRIEAGLGEGASSREKASSAYLAICLGLADSISAERQPGWAGAVVALSEREKFLRYLFYDSVGPAAEKLKKAMLDAGIKKPARSKMSLL